LSRQTSETSSSRQLWLWVTHPQYYLEEDGADRECLDPAVSDSGGWWTCHRTTQVGDLALLWRTHPRSDIGYLLQATSDAFSILDDPDAAKKNWPYACEWRSLCKFNAPLTIGEIRQHPYLEEWSALRARFQGKVFAIPSAIWSHLVQSLSARNPQLSGVLSGIVGAPASIRTEKDLEDRLVASLGILRRHGFDLEVQGRQVILTGHGGRIDLLCFDRKSRRHVVIELKNVQAGQNTFGQVMTYMGWVKENHRSRRPPLGLVIARGFDNRFLSAVANTRLVSHLTLAEAGLA
jgi:YhcG PDDEXK nuclease domain